jgi:hypothetical protein
MLINEQFKKNTPNQLRLGYKDYRESFKAAIPFELSLLWIECVNSISLRKNESELRPSLLSVYFIGNDIVWNKSRYIHEVITSYDLYEGYAQRYSISIDYFLRRRSANPREERGSTNGGGGSQKLRDIEKANWGAND